ncbi:hypothetical protein D1AOALGA4SA_2727 [Olavius algarvensis Delta 1 endosymbiont]|nr:hypothetical protein D1AOALGA4SA_2727 [Olavius algarvensis Delta 1 endosymbiont]
MESLRSINLKWTEYLKSKIRIPKSKICFWKFLSLIRLAVFLARGSAPMKLHLHYSQERDFKM